MSRLIDISVPVRVGMPVWPTDGPVEMTPAKAVADGGSSNVTRLAFGTHTGTHVDPPLHFIEGGRPADELDLDVLVGACVVVQDLSGDVLDRAAVARMLDEAESLASQGGASWLDGAPPGPLRRVLLKTKSSALWASRDGFAADYVGVDDGGATEIVARGIALVGIDYLSIERYQGGGTAHRTLLGAGVAVVEGLDLSNVDPGVYELICLPLRIAGGDGAPARAVLRVP